MNKRFRVRHPTEALWISPYGWSDKPHALEFPTEDDARRYMQSALPAARFNVEPLEAKEIEEFAAYVRPDRQTEYDPFGLGRHGQQ